ncbi:MAG: SAM-dependent methyltransferase [Bacilli bacterium]|nr:SAM-dependent methyltransferase [Bacilli bacterium]
MKISKRLQAIADLVDTKRVIDVGCDHGYLDIYLTLYKDCSCIATDISSNAMASCIDNIKKYHLENKISVMVTDGIAGIIINKDDTIVLSGMGTSTIMNILKDKLLPDKIIISSHNHLEELRRFMVSIGYIIDNEIFILERDISYIIIKFIKGKKAYNDYEYLLGPIMIKDINYRNYMLNKYQNILTQISDQNVDMKNYYLGIIKYLK